MIYNNNTQDRISYFIELDKKKKRSTDNRTWIQKCRDYQQQLIDKHTNKRERKEEHYRAWLKHPTRKGVAFKLPTFKSMKTIQIQILYAIAIVTAAVYIIIMVFSPYPWMFNKVGLFGVLFLAIFNGSALLIIVCIDYASYKRSKGKRSMIFSSLIDKIVIDT